MGKYSFLQMKNNQRNQSLIYLSRKRCSTIFYKYLIGKQNGVKHHTIQHNVAALFTASPKIVYKSNEAQHSAASKQCSISHHLWISNYLCNVTDCLPGLPFSFPDKVHHARLGHGTGSFCRLPTEVVTYKSSSYDDLIDINIYPLSRG